MEIIKLIGILIVIVGFALKMDTIATVVIAGIVTGLVAGMSPIEVLGILGKSFVSQRVATIFVITLPIVGICEQYGLKDKAVDLIRKAKGATAGRLISLYQLIRMVSAAFSLRVGGHPQFVRPLIAPMASGAAVAKLGEIDEETEDEIKACCAASENFGNFFGQLCFVGSSGTLLIASTLSEQGYAVDPIQVAMACIPIAVISVVVGAVHNGIFDKRLEKRMGKKQGGKA